MNSVDECSTDKTIHPSAVLASTVNDQFRFALEITCYLGATGPQELAALGVADVGQLLDLVTKVRFVTSMKKLFVNNILY